MTPDALLAFIERHASTLTLEVAIDLARELGMRLKLELIKGHLPR
jgi:hypothetical protein